MAMHIAYVNADRGVGIFGNKGASVHVREMVNGFAELGHHVSLLAARCGPPTAELLAEIIKVNSLVTDGGLPADADSKTWLRERQALANSTALAEAIVQLHQQQAIDLIYERYSLFSTAGVEAAATINVPVALEVNAPLLLEQQKYRRLLHEEEALGVAKRVFAESDAVFAVSSEVMDYTNAQGASPARVQVMPNGVDCRRFHPDVTPALNARPRNSFVIGFVGSLKPWHGIDRLLESFRELARLDPRFHLLVVGDGPLRQWIEAYSCGADIQQRVTITGWVDHALLPGLVAAMDVAVAPYPQQDAFYFSPLKLYEYMAAGLPVIASDIGQIADVIDDRVNGLLVPAGDTRALAEALQTLAKDPELCRQLGQRARQFAQQNTWADNAHQVLATLGTTAQSVGGCT